MNKRIILYILLAIIAVFCMSLKPKEIKHIDYVEILQIKNRNLLPILDSIIDHEKHCVYYRPDLYFSINSRTENDTITVHIEGFAFLIKKTDYKGCFEYKGHWFFINGQEIYKNVFAKTNKKKAFEFHKPAYITDDGKLVLVVYEDDSFCYWIYYYINNEFIFNMMYDPY